MNEKEKNENGLFGNELVSQPQKQAETTLAKQTNETEIKKEKEGGEDEIQKYKTKMQDVVIQQLVVNRVGSLDLSDKQREILFADFDDEEVCIRPDGLIYLPWFFYAERLTRAFPLQWSLIPADNPTVAKSATGKPTIIWPFYLFIKGVAVGYAFGEHIEERQYSALSYTESTESAKSNALMRLCKGFGMTLKLWDKNYAEAWKDAYAKQTIGRSQKSEWMKLSDAEIIAKKQNFIKAAHALNLDAKTRAEVLEMFGYKHTNEVKLIDAKKIYFALQAKQAKTKPTKKETQEQPEMKGGEDNED